MSNPEIPRESPRDPVESVKAALTPVRTADDSFAANFREPTTTGATADLGAAMKAVHEALQAHIKENGNG